MRRKKKKKRRKAFYRSHHRHPYLRWVIKLFPFGIYKAISPIVKFIPNCTGGPSKKLKTTAKKGKATPKASKPPALVTISSSTNLPSLASLSNPTNTQALQSEGVPQQIGATKIVQIKAGKFVFFCVRPYDFSICAPFVSPKIIFLCF